jgi:small subunit ribosomal protein S3
VGQKVHPTGFRLGIIKTWDSRWYAGRNFPQLLEEDIRIRDFLKERLYHAGVSKIEIERAADKGKKAKIREGSFKGRPKRR